MKTWSPIRFFYTFVWRIYFSRNHSSPYIMEMDTNFLDLVLSYYNHRPGIFSMLDSAITILYTTRYDRPVPMIICLNVIWQSWNIISWTFDTCYWLVKVVGASFRYWYAPFWTGFNLQSTSAYLYIPATITYLKMNNFF